MSALLPRSDMMQSVAIAAAMANYKSELGPYPGSFWTRHFVFVHHYTTGLGTRAGSWFRAL